MCSIELHDAAHRERRTPIGAGDRWSRIVHAHTRRILCRELCLLHVVGDLLDGRAAGGRRCELLPEALDLLLLLSDLFLLLGQRLLQGIQLLLDGSGIASSEGGRRDKRSDERRTGHAEVGIGHGALLSVSEVPRIRIS